jgi:Fe-S-cluster containining protein
MRTPSPHSPPAATAPGCKRCGTCCRKGGPILHRPDRELVEAGHLPADALVTLRRGETVFDPLTGRAAPNPGEAIKIRGRTDADWHCIFHDEAHGCRIYSHRPSQCRALQCWAPEALAALYTRERLTRRHLLGAQAELWDLLTEHAERCDLPRLRELAVRLTRDPTAVEAISRMLAYDQALRTTLVESGRIRPEHLDFLLGRPLERILPDVGLRLEVGAGGARRLVRTTRRERGQG